MRVWYCSGAYADQLKTFSVVDASVSFAETRHSDLTIWPVGFAP
jgi:hypothetical protein